MRAKIATSSVKAGLGTAACALRNLAWLRTAGLCLCIAAAGLSGGCTDGGANTGEPTPKSINLQFRTFDVGTDDCEDIFSYGDFNVNMVVTIEPAGDVVFNKNVGAELGSAAFQSGKQSVDLNQRVSFTLAPDEEFEIMVLVTEDDPINSNEPQPWSIMEVHRYDAAITETMSFTNGPGCFADDRLDMRIFVADSADALTALTSE